ncbi:unnamed protein product [Miscanthus lutarioriparius]|uniref:DUF7597 domain-containing protein n=1 Tax=Miscanthus lutarioriparius TaxID=422564 RepID=A0A811S8Q6_9POAL|nr:unnamed protein product [Miscanthus lutarioriparius]
MRDATLFAFRVQMKQAIGDPQVKTYTDGGSVVALGPACRVTVAALHAVAGTPAPPHSPAARYGASAIAGYAKRGAALYITAFLSWLFSSVVCCWCCSEVSLILLSRLYGAGVRWLFLAKRNTTRAQNVRRGLSEKLFAFGVPGFAACLYLVGLTMLAKKKFEGKDVANYELFFTCSQFIAWMSVTLVRVSGAWFEILYNPIMCFCWILKTILEIPHLQYRLTLLKAMSSFMEIISFCTATTFGLFVIVAAVVGQSGNKREVNSIEAPLILNDEKAEGEITNMIKDYNLWELLTFKFVNPVMDIGITRQLDFTDLLELPTELRATSCYDKLLSSWTAEYQNHHDNSSLLRAMSYSYGRTYLRLGLLKKVTLHIPTPGKTNTEQPEHPQPPPPPTSVNNAQAMVNFAIDPRRFFPSVMILEDGGQHRRARRTVCVSGGIVKRHEDYAIAITDAQLTPAQQL